MSTRKALHLIAQERDRQIKMEGYNSDHDKQWSNGQLAIAAAAYAIADDHRKEYKDDLIPSFWPFNEKYWKPSPDNRVKELVKAGALIVAELDRLMTQEKLITPQQRRKQETFNAVYDKLESRLNKTGKIKTADAWKEIKFSCSYSMLTVIFKEIMETMVEQGKAVKIVNGTYEILKPNAKA